MTDFAIILKRLYQKKKISLDKIQELLKDKKIKQKEYDYIIN